MVLYTLDTSAIITHKVTVLPKNFLVSAVVLAELIASANDDSARNHNGVVRLSESPLTLALSWRSAREKPAAFVGCFRELGGEAVRTGYIGNSSVREHG